MSKKLDLTNQRFGRLVTIEATDSRINGKVVWRCLCDCGEEKLAVASSLSSGGTRSCGCLAIEQMKKKNVCNTNIEYLRSDTISIRNKSGSKGVYFDKFLGKWCASILFQRELHYLGSFETKEEAIKARKDGEKIAFAKFLRLHLKDYKERRGKSNE